MDYLQYVNPYIVPINSARLVLNLVINGLPSILLELKREVVNFLESFKPCYKWITFNTKWDPEHGIGISVLF